MSYTLDILMSKTYDQLKKECARRGIANSFDKNTMILAIIRHDAYFEGRNDQKRGIENNAFLYSTQNVVPYVKESEQTKPKSKDNKREAYKLDDSYDGVSYFVKLTDEQVSFFRYLENNCHMGDLELSSMDECEFDEP